MNDELYYKYFGVCPFRTRGTTEGVVLKYDTIYLKIYDLGGTLYEVCGYLYGNQNPLFQDRVSLHKMREYAEEFRQRGH